MCPLISTPRQKISKEKIPEVRSAIQDLEAEWDKKWMDTLKETPLVSFLNEDPVSGCLIFFVFLFLYIRASHHTGTYFKLSYFTVKNDTKTFYC